MQSLIQGVRIMDPSTDLDQIADVWIKEGIITRIVSGSRETTTQLDACKDVEVVQGQGCLLIPGMVDIHSHVVPELIDLCVSPDEAGCAAGAVAVCDAGSLGWKNIHKGREILLKGGETKVFHFLHMAPEGEKYLPEIDYDRYHKPSMQKAIAEHKDVIMGIKVRAVENALLFNQYDIFKEAADIAHENGIPLMVHLGDRAHEILGADEVYKATERIIAILEKGDILTHVFTPAPGGLFVQGKSTQMAEKARAKGILLDASFGRGHLCFKNLIGAASEGIYPDLAGTDVVKIAEPQPHFYNLAMIASKLIAAGVPLKEAVRSISTNPLGLLPASSMFNTKGGYIREGAPANLTMLKADSGDYLFHDGAAGQLLAGNLLLRPLRCVINGRVHKVNPILSEHVPEYGMMRAAFPHATIVNE